MNYHGEKDVVRWYRGKRQRVEDGNEQAIRSVMDEAADYMRYNIMTRGTGWGEKPEARYETGKMVGQVESQTNVTERGNVNGRFGWLRDREDYFRYQEGGFIHNWTGNLVPGMYALADAQTWAVEELKERISENLNNA